MTDALSTAYRLIESHAAHAHFAGPQSAERIAKAEELLGPTFPPSYRNFLLAYGCGSLGGEEFYGILRDNPLQSNGVPDGVWLTLRDRQRRLPRDYIIVAATGDGGDYVLDTSQVDGRGECPVLEYWQGLPRSADNPRLVAADFGVFLLERVQSAIRCIEDDDRL